MTIDPAHPNVVPPAVSPHIACPPSSPLPEIVRLSLLQHLLPSSFSVEFLDAIRSVNPPSRWKILVIDEHSQRLLNSVLKQFDILEENVTRALSLLVAIIAVFA
jgi:hypothetical protein